MNRQRFEIVQEVLPGRVPGITRLRAFLKLALRAFALRCVELRPAEEAEGKRPTPAGRAST